MTIDYKQLTEVSGDKVSAEQIQRMYTRYDFARQHCAEKDVLELGCGSGQGLGFLDKVANRVVGGDYSEELLQLASRHYQGRIPLIRLDAQILPFKDETFDVIIIFEAIYYLKNCEAFVSESKRLLRKNGLLIICNANKDLPDFNPSPHSYRYFSPCDFTDLLKPHNFHVECFADCKVDNTSLKQRVFSFIKKTIVRLDLMPKTMAGKKIFKRIVFGKLIPLPYELGDDYDNCQLPCATDPSEPDRSHKVIFVKAQKISQLK